MKAPSSEAQMVTEGEVERAIQATRQRAAPASTALKADDVGSEGSQRVADNRVL